MTEEEEKGSVSVTVSSSQEYVQSKRLEHILDSKRRVLDEYYNVRRSYHGRGGGLKSESEMRRRIAEAVIEFCIEIEPVLAKSGEEAVFEQYEISNNHAENTISEIIDSGGVINGEYIPPTISLSIYRTVSKKLSEIGLGLELEIDREPAQI